MCECRMIYILTLWFIEQQKNKHFIRKEKNNEIRKQKRWSKHYGMWKLCLFQWSIKKYYKHFHFRFPILRLVSQTISVFFVSFQYVFTPIYFMILILDEWIGTYWHIKCKMFSWTILTSWKQLCLPIGLYHFCLHNHLRVTSYNTDRRMFWKS